jgi:uronate dehydrogenase
MARVLVTGSAGAIGRPVSAELRDRGHQVRAFDRVPSPGEPDTVVADIADPEAVREAMRDVDAVVHLAAEPHDLPFERLIGPNVLGLYNVMNAARDERVARVVLASSIQVVGRRRDPARPATTDEAHPGNHYALTKLWAETMGAMYAARFQMSVLAVRIAWMVRNETEARRVVALGAENSYLSKRDAGRFFALAVEADAIDFAVVYAVGRAEVEVFDLGPARRLLGYEPCDRFPEGLGFDLSVTAP